MRSYYQIQNAFQQAKKMDELLDIFEQADLRKFGQSHYVMNTVQNLMNDDAMRGRVMKLFRKAWDAFPQERYNMIAYIHRDEFWQMPEMYEYALQSLIPEASSFSPTMQWNAIGQIMSYGGDGKINTMVSRLLDLAVSQNKVGELSARVDDTMQKMPGWRAGLALKALIACRSARYDEASRQVEELLKETIDDQVASNVYWVLASELENNASTKALAVRVYERCVTGKSVDPFSMQNYEYSPMKRLVNLYLRDGRRDDARRMLLEFARPHDFSNGYPEEYISQMRMQGLASVARQLVDLGFPADAVPLYSESLATAESIPEGSPNYIGNREGIVASSRKGLDQVSV